MSEIENNDMLPADGSHDPEIASAPVSVYPYSSSIRCCFSLVRFFPQNSFCRYLRSIMEMERVIEFPHAHMDRRPRKRQRLGWDVASLALKVMSKVGFNFPIFLTLIHYTSAYILLAIFKALSFLPASPPSKSTPFSSLFALGAVMAFASGLANASLKHNSVGFYQMSKIAVTPTIVFAEFILFRKSISFHKVPSLSFCTLEGMRLGEVQVVGGSVEGGTEAIRFTCLLYQH